MSKIRWMVMLLLLVSAVVAAQERPYREGAVLVVTSVKVMDGQFDKYMTYLGATYKPVMEAQKKAKIILDYGIFSAQARSPDEPDLYLTVTYPNMASFDGLEDRMEPVAAKVTGLDRAQAEQASADRKVMREIMGSEIVRELTLK